MKFDNTPKEKKEYVPLPEGIYKWHLDFAEEKENKKGNMMTVLDLIIDGKKIKDWLNAGYTKRIKEFLTSAGRIDLWDKGEIHAEELSGMSGHCSIIIEESADYGKQNRIAEYLPKQELNDDIPF